MESPITYRVAYVVMVVAWAVFWPIVGYSYHDSNKKQVTGSATRIPVVNRLLLAVVFLGTGISLASPRWDSHLLWVAGWPVLLAGILLLLSLLWIAYRAARLLAWQPVPLGGRPVAVFAGGPFAWVRHPTYVCITVAAWITALLLARPLALYAAGCVTVAHLILIPLEERSTRGTDPAAYDAYAARVPMLIPWRFGRLPQPEAVPDDGGEATAAALFAAAQPVMSQREARAAARQRAKGAKAGQGGAGGGKGKGGRKGKGQGRARPEQPEPERKPEPEPNPRSRAWQLLEGHHD